MPLHCAMLHTATASRLPASTPGLRVNAVAPGRDAAIGRALQPGADAPAMAGG
jgi:hypothetical protein